MIEIIQKYKYILLYSVFFILAILILDLVNIYSKKSIEIEKSMLLKHAQIYFESQVQTRGWNASYGGVYVKPTDTLKPNPYLEDNTLKVDENLTLIKINPAWMTRQLSEISQKNTNQEFHVRITSLKPLNPNNRATAFEKKALEFLEKTNTTEYYELTNNTFHYMGALVTQESCMACHAKQNYKVGDIRGGISISLDASEYYASEELIHKQTELIQLGIIIILILFIILIYKLFRNQDLLKAEVLHKTSEIIKSKELKAQLAEKEEMMIAQSRHAAMGEMISMIAHQWRQPISVIAMGANNILVDVELDMVNKDDLRETSQDIISQTQELSKTIDDFREFFKPNKEAQSILLQQVIDDAFNVIGKSLENNNITVERNIDTSIQITTFSRELMQVMINLLKNAKEVLIEREIIDAWIKLDVYKEAQGVKIIVSDNAKGVDEKIKEEIFKPYFTTKGEINGTGLGLYMSKVIIQKHLGGNISVYNDENGACFVIELPLDNSDSRGKGGGNNRWLT